MHFLAIVFGFFCISVSSVRVPRKVLTCSDRKSCELCVARSTCLFVVRQEGSVCINKADRAKHIIRTTASTPAGCATIFPILTDAPGPGMSGTFLASAPAINVVEKPALADPNLKVLLDHFHPAAPPLIFPEEKVVEKGVEKVVDSNLTMQDSTIVPCDKALYKRETWRDRLHRSQCRTWTLMDRHRPKLSAAELTWHDMNPMTGKKQACAELEKNRLHKPKTAE